MSHLRHVRGNVFFCAAPEPQNGEPAPVLPVHLFVGTPFRMLCNESVFTADDLAFKVSRQTWMIFR